MIPITYLEGDATEPVHDGAGGPRIIAHVCNDLGGWGAGFVLALSAKWPDPEKRYRFGAKNTGLELGTNQTTPVGEGWQDASMLVCNMIAQHGYRSSQSNPIPLDYNALATCLASLREYCLSTAPLPSVHMPRIGCGLAGGTWDKVEPIIIEMLSAYDIPTYVYDLP